jgi:hypothetical protein
LKRPSFWLFAVHSVSPRFFFRGKDISAMRVFVFFLSLCFVLPQITHAQAPAASQPQAPSQLEQKLREVRFDLRVDNRKFSGSAAPVLKNAITEAEYVLVGKNHMTREIPLFTGAVCDLVAPQGLSGMAVEASPEAAEFVSFRIDKPDRLDWNDPRFCASSQASAI